MEQLNTQEVIVYGGAFNPPTLAHLAILQACVDYARPREAEVWLLPSGDRYDKTIPVPRERRLAYIAAMIDDTETNCVTVRFETSELDRRDTVETFDTVVEMAQRFPEYEMTWVFGADSTETMAQWKEGGWLLEHLPKLIVERPGSQVNPLARRATLLSVRTPEVSSTEVRRRLEAGEPVQGLVGPSVAALIA